MRFGEFMMVVTAVVLSFAFVGCGSSDDSGKGGSGGGERGQSADENPSRCSQGKNLWEGKCWDSFTLDFQESDFSLTLHRGDESREILRFSKGVDPAIFSNFDCSVNPGTTVCVLKNDLKPAVLTAVSFDTSTKAVLVSSFELSPEKTGDKLLDGIVIERDKRLVVPFRIPNDHPDSTISYEVRLSGYRMIYSANESGSVDDFVVLAPLPTSAAD